mmetsp:Transcript_35834/g.41818  ORF Transcript_35834/g.41818 Transcript_35834/m.41818 type:complete len:152 (+) Transcript_35834:1085-1540(+)
MTLPLSVGWHTPFILPFLFFFFSFIHLFYHLIGFPQKNKKTTKQQQHTPPNNDESSNKQNVFSSCSVSGRHHHSLLFALRKTISSQSFSLFYPPIVEEATFSVSLPRLRGDTFPVVQKNKKTNRQTTTPTTTKKSLQKLHKGKRENLSVYL